MRTVFEDLDQSRYRINGALLLIRHNPGAERLAWVIGGVARPDLFFRSRCDPSEELYLQLGPVLELIQFQEIVVGRAVIVTSRRPDLAGIGILKNQVPVSLQMQRTRRDVAGSLRSPRGRAGILWRTAVKDQIAIELHFEKSVISIAVDTGDAAILRKDGFGGGRGLKGSFTGAVYFDCVLQRDHFGARPYLESVGTWRGGKKGGQLNHEMGFANNGYANRSDPWWLEIHPGLTNVCKASFGKG